MHENVLRRWQVTHRQPFGARLLKRISSRSTIAIDDEEEQILQAQQAGASIHNGH